MRLCSSAHISCGFPMFGIVLLAWEEKLVPCLGGLQRWVAAWCFDSGELQWDPRSQVEDDDPGVRACVFFVLQGVVCNMGFVLFTV